jgi:hypothetical protein
VNCAPVAFWVRLDIATKLAAGPCQNSPARTPALRIAAVGGSVQMRLSFNKWLEKLFLGWTVFVQPPGIEFAS